MKYIITILLAFAVVFSYTQELEFQPQRMITDFRGVESIGNTILCYGDFGIITYSTDLGETWRQINLGDKHNIMKIVVRNGMFYAVSEFSLFKSSDGIKWIEKNFSDSPDIVSMAMAYDEIFVLAQEAIYKADTDLNFEKFVDLEEFIYRTEIQSDSSSLYVLEDNKYILSYNIENLQLDTIKIKQSDFPDDPNKPNVDVENILVRDVKVKNNELYFIMESFLHSFSDIYFLKYNQTTGIDVISEKMSGSNYKVTDDGIYFAGTLKDNENGNYNMYYARIIDTLNNEQMNPEDKSEYLILDYSYKYNEIKWINDETIIAVGERKLINISYDNGRNWEIKSCMSSRYLSGTITLAPYAINRDSIFSFSNTAVGGCRTTNGGVTWLPAKYSEKYKQEYVRTDWINYYSMNSIGEGIIIGGYISLKTDDFGESYEILDHSMEDAFFEQNFGLSLEDRILFQKVFAGYINIYIYDI